MTIRLKAGRTQTSKGCYPELAMSAKSSISSLAAANERNGDAKKPIAALKNNGNTCYLNSLLYVLRFTSRFLHNLHHIGDNSAKVAAAAQDVRVKSSSLGRNAGARCGPTSHRSNSTKDLLSSVALDEPPAASNKVLGVTDKLHELFRTLHTMEHGSKRTPLDAHLPCSFLQAVRDANPIFITNDQQDAHELLLHLFDNLRDACSYLEDEMAKHRRLASTTRAASGTLLWRLISKTRKNVSKLDIIPNTASSSPADIYSHSDGECDELNAPPPTPTANSSLIEDFRGVTVRSTKCLECESSTQCTEQFYDIAVPIRELKPADRSTPSDLYRDACLTPETLRDNNKFFCNDCRRLNEAVRSISFQRLPNIMILQQKRFMQTTDGFEKINTYMPTPLQLDCFCVSCIEDGTSWAHKYKLSGVIMHVGSTMQSGHYKSFVAASDHIEDYVNCPLSKRKASAGYKASAYFFGPNSDVCSIRNCCSIKLNSTAAMAEISGAGDDVWLECNDDKVTVISGKQLEEQLQETSETTPYLLFYERLLSVQSVQRE